VLHTYNGANSYWIGSGLSVDVFSEV